MVSDPTIIDTDKELFVLSGLYYWTNNKINDEINKLSREDILDDVRIVTKKVNSGGEAVSARQVIYEKAYEKIKAK